jgi:hypothetical protein
MLSARSLKEQPIRNAVRFVAKITEQAAGAGASRSPLFEWMGEECPYPFGFQLAKVELPVKVVATSVGIHHQFIEDLSLCALMVLCPSI